VETHRRGTHIDVFWIDHEYDREHAGDGAQSRFAAAVADNLWLFRDAWGDIAPVTFACIAWRLATPALLDPGFVRWHRRVLTASCERSPWDGGLTARVTLVSPLPAELTWSRQWWRDRGWRDWPQTFGQFVNPTEQDVARNPHLRTILMAEAPLPLTNLPAAPESQAAPLPQVQGAARDAVSAVVRELNAVLGPVVKQLDEGVPADRS
jgi:hypothetical protein